MTAGTSTAPGGPSAGASVAPAAAPTAPATDGSRQAGPIGRVVATLQRPRFGLLLLLVVLVVALVIGSGVGRGGPPSPAARAAAIESQIRCPSCQDVSVAGSAAPTAIAVRHEIERWTAEGKSDQQIQNFLVARYGLSILLSPPGSGLTGLVWLIPVVAGGIALVAMAVFFWRRGRAMAELRRDGRT